MSPKLPAPRLTRFASPETSMSPPPTLPSDKAYRDPAEPEFAEVSERIVARERVVVDVLYGDHQGGQRVISGFSLLPRSDGNWLATAARHWNVDRPDPR